MLIDIPTAQSIITDACQRINLYSATALGLILGTGAQESGYREVTQEHNGPALGLWQMEPATHDDCWQNFLTFRRPLADACRSIAGVNSGIPDARIMLTNHTYAAAMCRVRYYRVKAPLPAEGDMPGYAAYWKQWYNTPLGAGTEAEFIANWNQIVAPALGAQS